MLVKGTTINNIRVSTNISSLLYKHYYMIFKKSIQVKFIFLNIVYLYKLLA